MSLTTRQNVIGCFVEFLPMTVFSLGIVLTVGAIRRVGDEPRCAECGYQQAPAGENPDRCPECGALWGEPESVVRGRVVVVPWLLVTGSMLLALSIGRFVAGIDLGALTIKWSPTSWLVEEVQRSPVISDAWGELATRQLTPEQERAIAAALLDHRLRRRWIGSDADAWLSGMIVAGTLPPDLLQRYYHETPCVWIDAPSTVKDVRDVTWHLKPARPWRWKGYNVEARITETLVTNCGQPKVNPGKSPAKPDKICVRVRGWKVVRPVGTVSDPIIYAATDPPVIPADALWSEPFTIEQVIDVVE